MAKPTDGKAIKKGKRNRKWNRNKKECERYRAEGRRLKNKLKKLARYVRHHPNDLQAAKVLRKLK